MSIHYISLYLYIWYFHLFILFSWLNCPHIHVISSFAVLWPHFLWTLLFQNVWNCFCFLLTVQSLNKFQNINLSRWYAYHCIQVSHRKLTFVEFITLMVIYGAHHTLFKTAVTKLRLWDIKTTVVEFTKANLMLSPMYLRYIQQHFIDTIQYIS